MRYARVVLMSSVAVGIVACGASNDNTPTIPCTLPTGTTVALLYPIANATDVPDTLANVVIAVKPPLPANWQVVLGASGATYYGQPLTTGTPVPLPTPIATTPLGSTVQYSTFIGTGGLIGGTAFQVGLNNLNANCNTFPTFGSFTTQ